MRLGPVLLAYAAFIALGMPDGLLGIAWPTMRVDFGVPLDAVGMLLIAAVVGYMTSSFLSGTLVGRCLLYTSPSPRDRTRSRMPSSACKKKTKNKTK